MAASRKSRIIASVKKTSLQEITDEVVGAEDEPAVAIEVQEQAVKVKVAQKTSPPVVVAGIGNPVAAAVRVADSSPRRRG